MLAQLAHASAMVFVIVFVHLFGLAVLIRLLKSQHRWVRSTRLRPFTLLLLAAIGLFAIHTTEIWLYAILYLALGAANHIEEALYFSTVTYSTIGYGDVVLPHEWRILGATEGAAGIIMLGWSTAFLVSLLSQLHLLSHDWLSSQPLRSSDGQ